MPPAPPQEPNVFLLFLICFVGAAGLIVLLQLNHTIRTRGQPKSDAPTIESRPLDQAPAAARPSIAYLIMSRLLGEAGPIEGSARGLAETDPSDLQGLQIRCKAVKDKLTLDGLDRLGKLTGVYSIQNTVTGVEYIGASARDIIERWQLHLGDLECNRHDNQWLQSDWNYYGSDAFIFEIIEIVEGGHDAVFERERYWQDMNYDRTQRYNPPNTVEKEPSPKVDADNLEAAHAALPTEIRAIIRQQARAEAIVAILKAAEGGKVKSAGDQAGLIEAVTGASRTSRAGSPYTHLKAIVDDLRGKNAPRYQELDEQHRAVGVVGK